MSENEPPNPSPFEAYEARLMDEARAKIKHDMAELQRLTQTYPDFLKAMAAQYGLSASVPAPPQPEAKSLTMNVLNDLIEHYLTDPASAFHKLKHNSKSHYQTIIRMIGKEYGTTPIAEIGGKLDSMYAGWKEGGKVAMSQSKMRMLQVLFGFGTQVRDGNCAQAYGLIQKMDIEAPKARKQHLTRDQASMIRTMAHQKQRPSLAIAQAFQSDADLKQRNVIGEWVPMSEQGISITFSKEGLKWVHGLRWEEIDQNLILTHFDGDKTITRDLKKAPMVLQEFELIKASNNGVLPSQGPIVVSEYDGLPWDAIEFRRWWRRLADWCGLPKEVRNSDTKIRGQTEASVSETRAGIFE
jgi:hypothetical protein